MPRSQALEQPRTEKRLSRRSVHYPLAGSTMVSSPLLPSWPNCCPGRSFSVLKSSCAVPTPDGRSVSTSIAVGTIGSLRFQAGKIGRLGPKTRTFEECPERVSKLDIIRS
jgi:hypothetical protein